jgi:hypothetical protein
VYPRRPLQRTLTAMAATNPRSQVRTRPASSSPQQPPANWKENSPVRPPARNRPQSLDSTRRPQRISHIPGPDPVDVLGNIMGTPYHHDGPFEATLFARQIPGRAPVDALRESNAHTLAATPNASIVDCLEGHYPLQGVAVLPPGQGGVGMYEEYDVMVQDGGYKRWEHMVCFPVRGRQSEGLTGSRSIEMRIGRGRGSQRLRLRSLRSSRRLRGGRRVREGGIGVCLPLDGWRGCRG